MDNIDKRLDTLSDKLDSLLQHRSDYNRQLESLKIEFAIIKEQIQNDKQHISDNTLENRSDIPIKTDIPSENVSESEILSATPVQEINNNNPQEIITEKEYKWGPEYFTKEVQNEKELKSVIEKYIGENLFSKVGIIITIIGVAIGIKYSIDHQLISPLMRIVLGYILGAGLLLTGLKLRKKYENLSATLVSGSAAICYFITFFAYILYDIIPKEVAFIMMAIFTIFTVYLAISYNIQIISVIGLVGAYAVPFLLSDNSGKVVVLLSYVSIINIGILYIALRKYWKFLYYSAYYLSWAIYLAWYINKYNNHHFAIALAFSIIFFFTFYSIFLMFKIKNKDNPKAGSYLQLTSNSILFYLVGFSILKSHDVFRDFTEVYTIANALLHLSVLYWLHTKNFALGKLKYFIGFIAVLLLVVLVPDAVTKFWITICWSIESIILIYLAYRYKEQVLMTWANGLFGLVVFSLMINWAAYYRIDYYSKIPSMMPLFNWGMLSSIMTSVLCGMFYWLWLKIEINQYRELHNAIRSAMYYLLPLSIIFIVYYMFILEIDNYYTFRFANSSVFTGKHDYTDYNILNLKIMWIFNYTFVFISIFSLLNIYKIKSNFIAKWNFAANIILIVFFFISGLLILSHLRNEFLGHNLQTSVSNISVGTINIWIRYISILLLCISVFTNYLYLKKGYFDKIKEFEIINYWNGLVSILIIWLLSSELLNLMDLFHLEKNYKFGLSILWGVYSFALILIGIFRAKSYLRIIAISIFGITLAKLFFYDIENMDTIAKTILFLSIGLLLLGVSYLYNRFKTKIFKNIDK